MKPKKSRPSAKKHSDQPRPNPPRSNEPQLPPSRPLLPSRPRRDARPDRFPLRRPLRPNPSPPEPCRRLLEEERWNALVARHSPRLLKSIRCALRRAGVEPQIEDVEELAQESYCRLLSCGRLAPEKGGESGLSAFLARVGERVAFDRVRRERASKRGFGKLRGIADIGPDRLAACCVDRSPSPERTLLALENWRETVVAWREIVGGRTPGRDVVIVSLGLAGWSSVQISAACSGRLQPSTIDSIVGRTRSRLAEAGVALPQRSAGRQSGQVGRGSGFAMIRGIRDEIVRRSEEAP